MKVNRPGVKCTLPTLPEMIIPNGCTAVLPRSMKPGRRVRKTSPRHRRGGACSSRRSSPYRLSSVSRAWVASHRKKDRRGRRSLQDECPPPPSMLSPTAACLPGDSRTAPISDFRFNLLKIFAPAKIHCNYSFFNIHYSFKKGVYHVPHPDRNRRPQRSR
jgi:hypothetical protein